AKLRCGGSNPPGASNPHFVRTGGYLGEASPQCRRRGEPSSDSLFVSLLDPEPTRLLRATG
ncbi:MAG: hypothetical protein OZ918_08450, partial [Nitrospirales bacterium]|nr:hypothetical protein [Nitrospirales bacterium]